MVFSKTSIPKKYKYDIIVTASILLLSLILILVINALKKEGTYVTVEINGTVTGEYSLFKNGEYSLNGGTNILVIENGTAYLNYSNCPDHTCEKTGKIKYSGETIVCLPNRVSVTVRGQSKNSVDIIS